MNTQTTESLKRVTINGETYFKIEHSDRLRPFFMSIVSASNHWMFIGSNGGLTAGRKNADYALFPYYSDDKIVESTEITGPKTIVQLQEDGEVVNWEPFSNNRKFNISRNLYKNQYGNKVAFEEVNEDLKLLSGTSGIHLICTGLLGKHRLPIPVRIQEKYDCWMGSRISCRMAWGAIFN